MYFIALATDYDGTIAEDGVVAEATLEALRELKKSGRNLLLVTGRQLPDLKNVLPEIALFDLIVAENDGLLFDPKTGEETCLQHRMLVRLPGRNNTASRRYWHLARSQCIKEDLRWFGRKQRADTGSRAGDEGRLIGQLQIHSQSLLDKRRGANSIGKAYTQSPQRLPRVSGFKSSNLASFDELATAEAPRPIPDASSILVPAHWRNISLSKVKKFEQLSTSVARLGQAFLAPSATDLVWRAGKAGVARHSPAIPQRTEKDLVHEHVRSLDANAFDSGEDTDHRMNSRAASDDFIYTHCRGCRC